MAIYDINGVPISSNDLVHISSIKSAHPSYTDDQLLAAAIVEAQAKGITTKIVWDGKDIHFTGQTTHICKGFGGIDFNGSKIYLPDYDGGTIIQIAPDSEEDITVSYSALMSTYTTSDSLKGKVFKLNDRISGNASMCLGDRVGVASSQVVMYSSPCIKTSLDGYYSTGELFMPPTSGDVTCYNVHDIPTVTFDVSNATVVSYESNKMSLLIECHRSNTHIHHFTLEGRSNITTYHPGLFQINACCDIEIDNLFGVNPVQIAKTSGYIFSLNCVSFAHVHDVMIGDRVGWGAMGNGFLTNCVFERSYFERFDIHYAQFGYNVIRDCTINEVNYGIGNGTLLFENCSFVHNEESISGVIWYIKLRDDVVGVYDGDIIIRNCQFSPGKQEVSKTGILRDRCLYAMPSNSAFDLVPKKNRYISKCRIPDGTKYIFQTGTATVADQPMFANLAYNVEDTVVGSGTTILNVLGGQSATDVTVTDYHKKIS